MNLRLRRTRQQGFSMIEILVAILVLSVGLLGMAAMMATSLRNNQSATFRTQATNLAYDYIDMMRANIANAPLYRQTTFTSPAASCAAAPAPINYGACASAHACDRTAWEAKLCQSLPNGRGRVTVVPTGDNGWDVSIDICWSDDRAANAAASAACNNTGETLFNTTSRL